MQNLQYCTAAIWAYADIDTIVKAIFELKDHKDIIFIFTGHGNKARQIRETIKENKLTTSGSMIFYLETTILMYFKLLIAI